MAGSREREREREREIGRHAGRQPGRVLKCQLSASRTRIRLRDVFEGVKFQIRVPPQACTHARLHALTCMHAGRLACMRVMCASIPARARVYAMQPRRYEALLCGLLPQRHRHHGGTDFQARRQASGDLDLETYIDIYGIARSLAARALGAPLS